MSTSLPTAGRQAWQPTSTNYSPGPAAACEPTAPQATKRPLRTYSRRAVSDRNSDRNSQPTMSTGPKLPDATLRGPSGTEPPLPKLHCLATPERPKKASILSYFRPIVPVSSGPSTAASLEATETIPAPQSPSPPAPDRRKRRRLTTRPLISEGAGGQVDSNDQNPPNSKDEDDGENPTKRDHQSLPDANDQLGGASSNKEQQGRHDSTPHMPDQAGAPHTGPKRPDKRITKEMVQTTLSLSIAPHAGFTVCKDCGILYNPLNEKDRMEHKKRHAAHVRSRAKSQRTNSNLFHNVDFTSSSLCGYLDYTTFIRVSNMAHQHGDKQDIPDRYHVSKPGSWLPADHRVHQEWLGRAVNHVDRHGERALILVPNRPPYQKTPTGGSQLRDYNHMLQVLNHTPESAKVPGDHKEGWFGQLGYSDLMEVANAPHFFTRKVHDSARPVASPDDDNVIANACESEVYNVAHNVKLRDRFWIKGQPYSVIDMLASDPLAAHFEHGTNAFVQDGIYFSEPLPSALSSNGDIPVKGIVPSQGYLTALATRAIIIVEADNPAIGLLAFMGVDMDKGQHVKKGDETGMLHFGGSSHCLLFRKGVRVERFPDIRRHENVPVRGQVATVKP
ncbi:hypothetical protein B0H63DRAFT_501146 [Podospora didyma]|uniref:N-acetyltransferase ESCO zinc-finger domain-containing protein n=1 Tax=Podospora didyma TaxID=330526 RepID=A0AAE0TZ73_9PEZI|nr:hypothetical protein B0H63DRAFT_501146 [Podospora didyma]